MRRVMGGLVRGILWAPLAEDCYLIFMQPPSEVQPIGDELAIKWADGRESYISLEKMRRHCPCAGCKGEMDVMGNVYKGPAVLLSPKSFQLQRVGWVGTYGIQPVWGDGHSTGIYSFEYLRKLEAA